MKSLTSQLAYTYSANRKAERPFEGLLFTSLNGRTRARLEGMSNAAYKRWVNAEFWSESYERLWGPSETTNISTCGQSSCPLDSDTGGGAQVSANSGAHPVSADDEAGDAITEDTGQQRTHSTSSSEERGLPLLAPKDSVIYLTADSQDELTELKEGETYIIGGIVDHNRYKVRPMSPLHNWLTNPRLRYRISASTRQRRRAYALLVCR